MTHQLSVSGGTEKVKYYLSLGYYDQEGIMGGNYNQSNYNRLTLRANNIYTLFDESKSRSYLNKLTLTTNLAYSRIHSKGFGGGGGYYGGAITNALGMSPMLTPTLEPGSDMYKQQMAFYASNSNYVPRYDANGNLYTVPEAFGGGYQELTNPLQGWSYPANNYCGLNIYPEVLGDQVYPGGGDANDMSQYKGVYNFNISTTNVLTTNWENAYSGVKRCNDVILYMNNYWVKDTEHGWTEENQRELVKALAETGKPIILVLNEGRPRLITDIVPLASAVIDIMLPGTYGGDALANLMAGDANFSAKLPFTYPKEINSLNAYDYKVSEEVGTMEGAYNYDAKVSLLWPFGYGLSYTDYEYSNLRVDLSEFTSDDTLTVSVDVTNTGKVEGKEPVLLYSSDLVASLTPDNRRLRDFAKVTLKPGETGTVTFSLPAKSLAFVGKDGKWRLEKGEFKLRVGKLSETVTCLETKVWDEPNI